MQIMIAIRVDANEHIASGHAMRCLSVADALSSLGAIVVFITADDTALDMIKARGFEAVCLNTDWNDKDSELDVLVPKLEELHPDMVLIDSYQVTENYLAALSSVAKTAYIDDLNAFDYPVDVVIDYSVYAQDLDYPPNKTYLLGTYYVPLRAQFAIPADKLDRIVSDRASFSRILLTSGASDPYHIAGKIMRSVLEEPALDKYSLTVIKGRFWDDPLVSDLAKEYRDRVLLLENVEDMADTMAQSSLAVSAGGSTLYELCACLVPTVTFSYADNQLGNVGGFAKRDIMAYAGDVRDTKDIEKVIVEKLLAYKSSPSLVTSTVDKMRELDCGSGALHLAEKLLEISRKNH